MGIKIPAKYELLDGQSLFDLISYSNGVTSDADLKNIYGSILNGKIESLPITNISQFRNIMNDEQYKA